MCQYGLVRDLPPYQMASCAVDMGYGLYGRRLSCARKFRKWGLLCPFLYGSWVPFQQNVADAYIHAKFHLDPSNRLATIDQRQIQDRQTGQTDRQWSSRPTIKLNIFTMIET